MGVTQRRDVADALLAARTPDDVFELERALSTSRYDPERSARFDKFVSRWLRATNGAGPRAVPASPRHLFTFPLGADWNGTPAIVRVRVVESTKFYDGMALREIRRRSLRTIEIGGGPGMRGVRPR
jgi:hypothetical protein